MQDDFEQLLNSFKELNAWSKEKYHLRDRLIEVAKQCSFFHFRGRAEYFDLKRLPHIGETSVFRVPSDHRGKLKEFRGKQVKVVCIGNLGMNDRQLIAYELISEK